VVYCSNEDCIASQAAYRLLERHGYPNVRRYAGGLADWEAAGYPLEGDMVEAEARETQQHTEAV
jgi:3-mercaptopyruvate sulfurtransferase SseA